MTHTGVYRLYYKGSNKYYIGSTSQSFSKRFNTHLCELRKGNHHNQPLQRGYNKYGEDRLIMEPFIICDKELALELELIAITSLRPEYNASKKCTSRLGVKASKNTRKLMSEAKKGRKLTEEHKQKISKGVLRAGYRVSESHKEVLRNSMTNRVLSSKTKLKLREANIGKKHSEDTKVKMSISHSKPKNNTIYSFINNDGLVLEDTIYNLKKRYNLGSKIYLVLNGKRKHHKGWRLNISKF